MTLIYSLTDFEDEDEEVASKVYDGRCRMDLVPLGGNLFRVPEPVSLTPFGPMGPGFTVGQIIEAEPLGDGVLTYVRSRFTPQTWSHSIARVPREALTQAETRSELQRLRELGYQWEWAVGNLTVQHSDGSGNTSGHVEQCRRIQALLSDPRVQPLRHEV